MTKWTRRLGWPHAALAIALFLIALPLARAAGVTLPTFGDPIAGLTATEMGEFIDGKTEFNEAEEPDEGLGPAFNGASCVECHSRPAIGGDSDITETRFGRYDTVNGKRVFNPLTELGGSLLQKKSISPECAEVLPPEHNVTTERKTTPLFGLGLVDAVPDGVLAGIAALQQRITPNLAGRVHRVIDAATGAPRAGRFGWKAQQASLFTFSGDAYLNEMGITTPLFPTENAPNGNLATLQHCEMLNEPGTADPEDKGDGIVAFFNFMSRLAPPPRGPITSQVQAGEALFTVGCAACHVPTLVTGPNRVRALQGVVFHPYSDFLLHDMGALGDSIEQGDAKGNEIRTAPLWGLRARKTYLHDGRATSVIDAIQKHDGQGKFGRDFFNRLNASQQANLKAFLDSL